MALVCDNVHMSQILKETTEWDASFHVPNHTYLLDTKGHILAYAKADTGEVIKLKGTIRLDKRRRSFIKSKHAGLSALINNHSKSSNIRTFKVLSKGNEYLVELDNDRYSCTCAGYTYRGKCKHITAVAEKVK